MNKKTLKLDSDKDNKVSLIGISSSLKDYRLAHFLGKSLEIEFEKQKDIEINVPKGEETLYYPNLSFLQPDSEQKIHLLSNKVSGYYFFPSLKSYDYILFVIPESPLAFLDEKIKLIRKITEIYTLNLVNQSLIKEKERLYWFTE